MHFRMTHNGSGAATDKLCRGCAEQHGLCIRCGADLEGKERRKVKFGGLK